MTKFMPYSINTTDKYDIETFIASDYDGEEYISSITYRKKGTDMVHREDGPAYETYGGYKEWCINGFLHREDGPAVDSSSYFAWFISGNLHREDGPAVEYKRILDKDRNEWWINGDRISPEKELILNKWWNDKNGI